MKLLSARNIHSVKLALETEIGPDQKPSVFSTRFAYPQTPFRGVRLLCVFRAPNLPLFSDFLQRVSRYILHFKGSEVLCAGLLGVRWGWALLWAESALSVLSGG